MVGIGPAEGHVGLCLSGCLGGQPLSHPCSGYLHSHIHHEKGCDEQVLRMFTGCWHAQAAHVLAGYDKEPTDA